MNSLTNIFLLYFVFQIWVKVSFDGHMVWIYILTTLFWASCFCYWFSNVE